MGWSTGQQAQLDFLTALTFDFPFSFAVFAFPSFISFFVSSSYVLLFLSVLAFNPQPISFLPLLISSSFSSLALGLTFSSGFSFPWVASFFSSYFFPLFLLHLPSFFFPPPLLFFFSLPSSPFPCLISSSLSVSSFFSSHLCRQLVGGCEAVMAEEMRRRRGATRGSGSTSVVRSGWQRRRLGIVTRLEVPAVDGGDGVEEHGISGFRRCFGAAW
jgi:hypothetical protein